MSKYTFEFKFKIVQEYLSGEGGYAFLAKKHNVKDGNQIHRWVNSYREFGEEGLLRKRQNKKYSVQFKLSAIELYQTTEMSYREVANSLGINNAPLIVNWMRHYRDAGIDGLSKSKGRPPIMNEKKANPATSNKSKTSSTDQERIKELEKQVRTLKIQNAFLKELRKLRKQEAQQKQMNQSHASLPASEDNSN